MKPLFRMLGWLLLVGGLALGAVAVLADAGVMPFGINFLGRSGETHDARVTWMVRSLGSVALGAALLWFTRRNWGKQR